MIVRGSSPYKEKLMRSQEVGEKDSAIVFACGGQWLACLHNSMPIIFYFLMITMLLPFAFSLFNIFVQILQKVLG